MPFAALLPFVVIAIIIAAIKSAETKRQQELKRRQAQEQTQTAAPAPAARPVQPVRPTVHPTVITPAQQTTLRPASDPHTSSAAKPAAPRNAARPAAQRTPTASIHPEHDLCAIREDSKKPVPSGKHPEHDLCSLDETVHTAEAASQKTAGPVLNFTPDNILRGVVFSEIFGKPKALR